MIRAALPDDGRSISRIEAECFGNDAWSADQIMTALTVPNRLGWIAGDVAYVMVSVAGETADLERIAVRAEHRRSRLASQLLDLATVELRGRDIERLLLEVEQSNDAAQALYATYGGVKIATRTGYYGPDRDAAVWQIDLLAERL